MNGPDHFAEAERLIGEAARAHQNGVEEGVAYCLGSAQTHAILALTAATAANIRRNGSLTVDVDGWDAAFGAPSGNR